jgi:putative tricarboxylic transport membrane protein
MRNSDFLASLLMLIIVGVFTAQISGIPFFGIVFPRAALIAMGVLSAGLLISVFVRKEWAKNDIVAPRMGTVAAILLIAAGWISLMEVIGFYVVSVIAVGLLMLVIDRKARTAAAFTRSIIAVAIELGLFYVAFATLLEVPLPRGILF